MWLHKSNSEIGDDFDDFQNEINEIINHARQSKNREDYSLILNLFINHARIGLPIDDQLIHFIADAVEQFQGGTNVDDVIGKRNTGSPGKNSYAKSKQHKRIAAAFISRKIKGMRWSDAISDTASECGVTERTVENVRKSYAEHNPSFNYPTEKV